MSLLACAVFLCLALLTGFYGNLIRKVGSGTGFYRVWFGIAAIFLILLLASLAGGWKIWLALPVSFRAAVYACLILLLASFLVIGLMIFSGFRSDAPAGLDYIIVLGAQVHPGRPSAVLKYRLDRAAAYLNESGVAAGRRTICICSGGQGKNEPYAEALGMRDYLLGKGIPAGQILTEEKSRSTAENFAFSRKWIPDGASVGVVTNNFHLNRAMRIAGDQGFRHVYGISAPSRALYLPNNLLREYLAMVKYFLMRLGAGRNTHAG